MEVEGRSPAPLWLPAVRDLVKQAETFKLDRSEHLNSLAPLLFTQNTIIILMCSMRVWKWASSYLMQRFAASTVSGTFCGGKIFMILTPSLGTVQGQPGPERRGEFCIIIGQEKKGQKRNH